MNSSEILKQHFEQKKALKPQFSVRAMAMHLGFSGSYASRILSGKKPIPLHRLNDICKVLEIDAFGQKELERVLLLEKSLTKKELKKIMTPAEIEKAQAPSPTDSFEVVSHQHLKLLDKWYFLPLLDLITCKGFKADPQWISDQLGLKEEVAESAWETLLKLKCVHQDKNGKWSKNIEHIRFPSSRAHPKISRFHSQMLSVVKESLEHQPQDFERRLVLGATIATESEQFFKAKLELEDSFIEQVTNLSKGEGEDVYYLALQLVPLTKG